MIQLYANDSANYYYALDYTEKGWMYLFWWDSHKVVEMHTVRRKAFQLSPDWYRIA
jgi:hypothetical protein